MQKFMDFFANKVAPVLQKIADNAYVSGLQSAILKTVPMVFVSSLITVYNVLREYITYLPDLSAISNYSFGLMSLFMAFLVPFYICEKKSNNKGKFVAGLTGIALYMILVNPGTTEEGLYLYNFSCFGAGGMFVTIISGIFTSVVFTLCSKIQIFNDESAMPDFCKEWFDTLLPITITLLAGWFLVIYMNIDLYEVISNMFLPLVGISNTYIGVLILELIPTVLYSMGISSWVFEPVQNPINAIALSANLAAFQAGSSLPYIMTNAYRTAYLALGGRGVTFMLVVYCAMSKSKRLKALGRASMIPNLMNINEPIVFGAIAWNPILMIPMWICNIVAVTISYVALRFGLVDIPYENFYLWYLPIGITAFFVAKSFSGVLLVGVIIVVTGLIWYPFFKIYEKKVIEEEQREMVAKQALASN